MRIEPCHGCPIRDGCETREIFRKKARGMGAVSVRFRCSVLAAALRRGRRITLSMPFEKEASGSWGADPDWRIVKHAVAATITGQDSSGTKFRAVVDPGQGVEDRFRFLRYRRHTRIIRFLDEPDMGFCINGELLRDGKCDTSHNYCICNENAALAGGL